MTKVTDILMMVILGRPTYGLASGLTRSRFGSVEIQYGFICPYDCGMDNPKRSHNAWIAAVKPATATHKRVVQPIRVLLP